jgi:hypothetical protein
VFPPLTPSEMVAAIGAAARVAARAEDPGGAFSRGQLRSASSAARHLAVELATYARERRAVAAEVAGALAASELAAAEPYAGLARRLAGGEGGAALADPLCELLAALRVDDAPAALALRGDVRAILARMADREVALLTAAIE